MESGLKTIFGLFDGTKIFQVPEYQRAYAWKKQHLSDFVDDLENQRVDRPYFLGTVLLREREKQNYFTYIDIVDGQQRMTTVVIFVKLLLAQLKSIGEDTAIPEATYLSVHGEHKLSILPQDNHFFRAYILEGNVLPDGQIDTPSQRRLWEARAYLKERLANCSIDELRTFRDVLDKAKILTYIVDDPSEAALIFETTNDRGKRLTNLEKTKSFLMYKAYLAFEHPESHLNDIQAWFSRMYQDFDEIRNQNIGEDTILQYHFTAFESWRSGQSYKGYYQYVPEVKNKINKFLKAGDHPGTQTFITRYARELQQSFRTMKTLLLSSDEYMTNLFAVGRPANFYPLLIKTWQFDEGADKTQFKRVARLAEIYSFRVLGIRRRRSDAGRETLYILARDFDGDFPKLIKKLQELILGYCSDSVFYSRLMSPTLYDDIYRSDQRYLFWQYENYLRRSEQPVASPMSYAAFISQDSRTKLTTEHIAPQTPKTSKIIADTSIEPELTEEFQEKYLHCLGNLTFDPLSANSSKSNNDVPTKNQGYFVRAPFKTQNELDTFLNPETKKWDAHSAETRREKILKFAMSYWDPITV